jgi:Ca-activated chloride channel family protein
MMNKILHSLFGFSKVPSFEFGNPWMLLLLLLIPVLAWLKGRKGGSAAILYSSVQLIQPWHNKVRSNAGMLIHNLRWFTLSLAILALAQPRFTESETAVSASGIDIVIALDMSGSMEAMDFRLRGNDVSRFDMAKEVLKQFISKRPSDRIGLVAFGGRPYLVSPLTLDHDFLLQNIDRLELGTVKEQNTAIGSAIMSALARLKDINAKSKIVILMTDGQNNAGKIMPLTAAEAAKTLGVKIYTVGIGKRGDSYVLRRDFFGRIVKVPQAVDIDEDTLRKIADLTGGRYYRADDTERFRSIYNEIDKLEKTEVVTKKFVRHYELFKWFILASAYCLLAEAILNQTIYRRLP